MHRFTETEKAFIKSYYLGRSRQEITDRFNEVFQSDITISQISGFLKRYNLKTGVNGCFKKGAIPHNKGKKLPPEVKEKILATTFKAGHIPKNSREIGSERIGKDGYIEVKIAESTRWKPKHIYIWEQAYGKLPKNHCIIFLDGNIRNFDLKNLKCITRGENLFLNVNKLRFSDSDLTSSAVNIAKLHTKIKEANNETTKETDVQSKEVNE